MNTILTTIFGPRTLDRLIADFTKLEQRLADLTTTRIAEAKREREEAAKRDERAYYLECEANRAERIRERLRELLD